MFYRGFQDDATGWNNPSMFCYQDDTRYADNAKPFLFCHFPS